MPNYHEVAFNQQKKKFGQIFGQPFEINTVNYTATDQSPVIKHNKKKYKVEVGSKNLSQPQLPNVSYYCVHGDYYAVNSGDLMVPLRSDSDTPIVTVLNKSPFEEIVGFRTSKTCDIYNGQTLLYSNCYFDFATRDQAPANALHNMLTSNGIPQNTIIMYARDLRSTSFDTEGLLIKETSSTPNMYWKVQQIVDIGNLMSIDVIMSVIE